MSALDLPVAVVAIQTPAVLQFSVVGLSAAGRPVREEGVSGFVGNLEQASTTLSPKPVTPVELSEGQQPDIVVQARSHTPIDPLEKVNAKSFAMTEKFDGAVLGPVSHAYDHTVPEPIQNGISNFLSNLREPGIFLNFLVQLKPGRAAETFGRFAINTTIGGAGLFDVAKRRPFKLPFRPNGFADSMGYYGVKPGVYLFLPLMGPTTTRDLVGFVLDRLVLPLSIGKPFNRLSYSIPTSVANALDRRAAFDEQMLKVRAASNPYVARRDFYLMKRQSEIDGLRRSNNSFSKQIPSR